MNPKGSNILSGQHSYDSGYDQTTGSPLYQECRLTGPRHIRLVRFYSPNHGPYPDQFCVMISVPFEKAPPYMALSYTWDDQPRDYTLTVNNTALPITRNLSEAIASLRHVCAAEHLHFWADAICINQDDVEERNAQIRLMNAIYRFSEKVSVWLGPASDESNEVMDAIEFLARRGDSNASLLRPLIGILANLHCLFHRPWWRRAWIVQEVSAVAGDRLQLHRGQRAICWTDVDVFLEEYIQYFAGLSHIASKLVQFAPASHLRDFRIKRRSGACVSLLEVLQHLREYQCKDPRDKVFAALGMTAEVSDTDIEPDYSHHLSSVYLRVVEFCFQQRNSRSLDFLGYVQPGDSNLRNSDLPSWCPDWRQHSSGQMFRRVQKHNDTFDVEGSHVLFQACSPLLPESSMIVGPCLFLDGVRVAYVKKVLPYCHGADWDDTFRTICFWKTEIPTGTYRAGETYYDAFHRVIIADVERIKSPGQIEPAFERIKQTLDFLDPVQLGGSSRGYGELERRKEDIQAATSYRSLFLTEEGHMGLGPMRMRTGDEVCLVHGGTFPYILRHDNQDTQISQSQFVGECYVHGLMDGEASGRPTTSFRIF